MDTHEARLRAMFDPDSQADWGLNDTDRAAIRWALDAIERLKDERDEVRRIYGTEAHMEYERRKAVAAAAAELNRAIEAYTGATTR